MVESDKIYYILYHRILFVLSAWKFFTDLISAFASNPSWKFCSHAFYIFNSLSRHLRHCGSLYRETKISQRPWVKAL